MNSHAASSVSTIPDLFHQSAARFSDRPALAMINGQTLSYLDVSHRVMQLAKMLTDEGIVPGDKVAIYSENHMNWGIAYLAIQEAGAVVVPILPDFHPGAVSHILRHSESRAVFSSPRLLNRLDESPAKFTINLETFQISRGGKTWETLLRHGEAAVANLKARARRFLHSGTEKAAPALAVIIYTSGTTGHSKGVMLTHQNLIANIQSVRKLVNIIETDRFLSLLPLAHTFECTLGFLTPLSAGASVHYLDRAPTAPVLLPALQTVRPTVMLSVPLIIEKIYKQKIIPAFHGNFIIRNVYGLPPFRKLLNKKAGKKLLQTFGGELKLFCIGGAALAPDTEFFLREAGFPYCIGYGLTETAPLVTGTPPETARLRSAGKAILNVQVRIDHPDPVTGAGEIWVKGPNVMAGYYRDPEKTAEVLTSDGWFHTGDLGFFDEDGYLFIKGRSKNMILGPSGENIYPEELESLLNEHDWVAESLVLEDGKEIVARVFLNSEIIDQELGKQATEEAGARKRILAFFEELKTTVNQRSSRFAKIARIIEQPEPFEKTPTQKIKRFLYTTKSVNGDPTL